MINIETLSYLYYWD